MSKNKGKRSLLVLVSVIFLLLLTAFMAKPGYCRGWWGKQNLIMRSLWLCSCPPELEQTLYPENVEVMFSACQDIFLMPTWDGYFFVRGDERYNGGQSYILSGYTGEKLDYAPPNDSRESMRFYTHQLLYVTYPPLRARPSEIHHTDGWYITLERLSEPLPAPFMDDDTANPEMVALFKDITNIFLHRSPDPFIVALSVDTKGVGQSGFILSGRLFPDLESEWPAEFLEASELPYINIPPPDWNKSPDGRFQATQEGIYDATTGERVVDMIVVSTHIIPEFNHSFYRPCCWYPHSDAVIYMPPDFHLTTWELASPEYERFNRLLMGFPLQMEARSAPILKIHIPQEYHQNNVEK